MTYIPDSNAPSCGDLTDEMTNIHHGRVHPTTIVIGINYEEVAFRMGGDSNLYHSSIDSTSNESISSNPLDTTSYDRTQVREKCKNESEASQGPIEYTSQEVSWLKERK